MSALVSIAGMVEKFMRGARNAQQPGLCSWHNWHLTSVRHRHPERKVLRSDRGLSDWCRKSSRAGALKHVAQYDPALSCLICGQWAWPGGNEVDKNGKDNKKNNTHTFVSTSGIATIRIMENKHNVHALASTLARIFLSAGSSFAAFEKLNRSSGITPQL